MAEVISSLYLNPSYATLRYDVQKKERSELQNHFTRTNFKSNQHKGKVSKNSCRKIRLAVQWLVCLADRKKVIDPLTKKTHWYRAGLLTLNLPTGSENVSPQFFKEVLLPSFLSAANYQFDLKNYIWKLEIQKRGSVHAHITIDKYLPWQWVQSKWNSILDKHGLLEPYRERFQNMSESDYVLYRLDSDSDNLAKRYKSHKLYIQAILKAYKKGVESGWSQPNTTDIHSVKKVKRLAAYMVKYLSKDPGFGEGFKGRYWSASHSLSKLRTVHMTISDNDLIGFCKTIDPISTDYKDIYYLSKIDGDIKFLGAIYFLKRSIRSINSNNIIRESFRLIKSMYNQSRLDEMPFLQIQPIGNSQYQLNKLYNYAN